MTIKTSNLHLILTDELINTEVMKIANKNAIILIFNKEGKIAYANDKCCSHTSYDEQHLIGKPYNIFFNKIKIKNRLKDINKSLLENNQWNGILKNKYKNDVVYWMMIDISAISNKEGNTIGFTAYCTDFTTSINQKQQIALQNTYDNLTGLLKGGLLDKTLKANIGAKQMLILLEVSNFREINMYYGKEAGDSMLVQIADSLKNKFDKDVDIFRTQGISFAIHLLDLNNKSEIIKKIVTLFESTLTHKEHEIHLTVNMGISVDTARLYEKANTALIQAKKKNKPFVVNDETLERELELTNYRKKTITNVINNAVQKDYVTPYYQPIHCNKENKIVKFECLARIVTSDGELFMPNDFIAQAKKIRKYGSITQAMVKKTFEMFKDKKLKFSINLSIEDIVNISTKMYILNEVSKFPNPQNIIFEILEDEDLHIYGNKFVEFVHEVKNYGCEIAIDDFGTGFSNFRNLMNMEFDFVKIDGGLIQKIEDEKVYKILKNIVALANDLGAKTIAEFVSDEKIQEKIISLGIDFSQGWYFGRPEKEVLCQ